MTSSQDSINIMMLMKLRLIFYEFQLEQKEFDACSKLTSEIMRATTGWTHNGF